MVYENEDFIGFVEDESLSGEKKMVEEKVVGLEVESLIGEEMISGKEVMISNKLGFYYINKSMCTYYLLSGGYSFKELFWMQNNWGMLHEYSKVSDSKFLNYQDYFTYMVEIIMHKISIGTGKDDFTCLLQGIVGYSIKSIKEKINKVPGHSVVYAIRTGKIYKTGTKRQCSDIDFWESKLEELITNNTNTFKYINRSVNVSLDNNNYEELQFELSISFV